MNSTFPTNTCFFSCKTWVPMLIWTEWGSVRGAAWCAFLSCLEGKRDSSVGQHHLLPYTLQIERSAHISLWIPCCGHSWSVTAFHPVQTRAENYCASDQPPLSASTWLWSCRVAWALTLRVSLFRHDSSLHLGILTQNIGINSWPDSACGNSSLQTGCNI